jgi:hypothetical protein
LAKKGVLRLLSLHGTICSPSRNLAIKFSSLGVAMGFVPARISTFIPFWVYKLHPPFLTIRIVSSALKDLKCINTVFAPHLAVVL